MPGPQGRSYSRRTSGSNQLLATTILELGGFQVDTVSTGVGAVDAVRARRYDVVMVGCQMPEMDGYEATGRIRAHEDDGRRTPIAITEAKWPGERQRCLEAGMDDYLPKTFNTDALLAVVTVVGIDGGRVPVEDSQRGAGAVLDESNGVALMSCGSNRRGSP